MGNYSSHLQPTSSRLNNLCDKNCHIDSLNSLLFKQTEHNHKHSFLHTHHLWPIFQVCQSGLGTHGLIDLFSCNCSISWLQLFFCRRKILNNLGWSFSLFFCLFLFSLYNWKRIVDLTLLKYFSFGNSINGDCF